MFKNDENRVSKLVLLFVLCDIDIKLIAGKVS